jgi:ATP-binding cassette subfamily B protein RaxB
MISRLDHRLWGGRRVQLVRQTESSDCAVAALVMVANYHGHEIDLRSLRSTFRTSTRGSSAKAITDVADTLQLNARVIRLSPAFLGKIALPAILHWDSNHFVVLERIKQGRALVHDPSRGTAWVAAADLAHHYSGVAIELRPTTEFTPVRQKERLQLRQVWSGIRGLKSALLQTFILSVIVQLFALASPYYLQIAIDEVIPTGDHDLLTLLALGFAAFALVYASATFLRSFVLISSGNNLGFGIATNVARQLFRLPIPWFEARHIGDVLSRFQSVTPIRQFLSEGAVAGGLDGLFAITTLIVMFVYSPLLSMVAVGSIFIYVISRWVTYPAQLRHQERAVTKGSIEQSTFIENVRGITTLRLFNKEQSRHSLWQSKLVDSVNSSISLNRVGTWQRLVGDAVFGLESVFSTFLAVLLVINGGFSVGMLFAFLAYKNQFQQRAGSLVDQWMVVRMLEFHLERISEIALAQHDVCFDNSLEVGTSLVGDIEVKELSFRYGSSEPWVLQGASFRVRTGEHIAITGPSGGGKTTLVKLLLGLLQPTEGAILIDGVPFGVFGYRNFRDQVSGVLQNDQLFAGTILENVTMFDERPDFGRANWALDAAALSTDIETMPMGFHTLVGDMGSSLSGGQKQRVLLARALYRQPELLILDEATSHLDATREQLVNAAVSQLGITRIIVAHRIETIRQADRVYSIEGGSIREITDAVRSGAMSSSTA